MDRTKTKHHFLLIIFFGGPIGWHCCCPPLVCQIGNTNQVVWHSKRRLAGICASWWETRKRRCEILSGGSQGKSLQRSLGALLGPPKNVSTCLQMFGPCMALLGLEIGLEMVLGHVALYSLNISSYRAICNHFRPEVADLLATHFCESYWFWVWDFA